jgi:hypothetical protein
MNDFASRARAALHKIQSYWFLKIGNELVLPDTHACSPKHLKVGIESALASCEAIQTLLIEKGIVTLAEVQEAVAHACEERADEREAELRATYGPGVTLE